MDTDQHGSPDWMVDMAHGVLGTVDLDPCSDHGWNQSVRATKYMTESDNGLISPWGDGFPVPGWTGPTNPPFDRGKAITVFCNPPGSRDGSLVTGFWNALVKYYMSGYVRSAIWIGYSLEQLSRLQRADCGRHPLQYPTLFPSRRPRYVSRTGPGNAPTHSGYVTLLPESWSQSLRYPVFAGRYGYVTLGWGQSWR